MIHKLFPNIIGIYDNVMADGEFKDLIDKLDSQHITRDKIVDSFDYDSVPEWIQPLTLKMKAIFDTFCVEAGIDNIYEPNFYQTQRTQHYRGSNAFQGNWEPHNDIYERANWSVTYYARVDTESVLPDGYIGGELSLMDRLDYSNYPDSVQLVAAKTNRIVIFSPLTTHRIRPYFGKTPRLSITQHLGRDNSIICPNAENIL
jgi:Rps23 Pro-64 3,4-dihydroxylase Tpa1-like proline 4-hydroxylase